MPANGGPGQHATLKAIRAIPATRPAKIPIPASSWPNRSQPTEKGTTSKANHGGGGKKPDWMRRQGKGLFEGLPSASAFSHQLRYVFVAMTE